VEGSYEHGLNLQLLSNVGKFLSSSTTGGFSTSHLREVSDRGRGG
jgi:hypothetical protein